LKKLFRKATSAWSKVPAGVKTEGKHVALVFVVTFVATAAVAFPSIVAQLRLGHLPSFSVLHALIAASASAGLKATIPVVRTALVALVSKYAGRVQAKRQAKLLSAVEAYIAANPQLLASTTVAPKT